MNKTLEGFAPPMRDIGEVLDRLAAMDFSHGVERDYPEAYGRLRDNVNRVVNTIRSTIKQIAEMRSSSPKARGLSPRIRNRWPRAPMTRVPACNRSPRRSKS